MYTCKYHLKLKRFFASISCHMRYEWYMIHVSCCSSQLTIFILNVSSKNIFVKYPWDLLLNVQNLTNKTDVSADSDLITQFAAQCPSIAGCRWAQVDNTNTSRTLVWIHSGGVRWKVRAIMESPRHVIDVRQYLIFAKTSVPISGRDNMFEVWMPI